LNGANRWAGCSVCARPDIAEVNAAIVGGATVRSVASQYGIARSTLDLHKRRCGVAKAPKTPKAASALPAVDVAVKAAQSEIAALEARTPEAAALLPIVTDSIALYWEARNATPCDFRTAINALPEVRNGLAKLHAINEAAKPPENSTAAWFRHELLDELRGVLLAAVSDELARRSVGAALLAWERSRMGDEP